MMSERPPETILVEWTNNVRSQLEAPAEGTPRQTSPSTTTRAPCRSRARSDTRGDAGNGQQRVGGSRIHSALVSTGVMAEPTQSRSVRCAGEIGSFYLSADERYKEQPVGVVVVGVVRDHEVRHLLVR